MRTTVESLIFLGLMLLAFWLLILRPARARSRAQARLQDQISPGQEVMTTSGLFATVAAVEDDVVVLETEPGVRTRWTKAAVARIVPAEEPQDLDAQTDPESAEAPETLSPSDATASDQTKRPE
jgi:preprotein translocase subunit YajC